MTGTAITASWRTADGATLRGIRRPDGRWQLKLPEDRPKDWGTLVDAAVAGGCGTLLVSRPADQTLEQQRCLRGAGFRPCRTEVLWRIPIGPYLARPVRSQHRFIPVTDLDVDAVTALDNTIRADIPGTEGWHGTVAELQETLEDPELDPALYRIAQHAKTGSLDGLIRVWNRTPEPRLGCIGVVRSWRRTSLALALVHSVAAPLLERGVAHITTETDSSNGASHLMAANHGGTQVGALIEWRRARQPAPASPVGA